MPHNAMQCLGSWAGDVALELSTVHLELRWSLLSPVWCCVCGAPYEGNMHTPTEVVETCYTSKPKDVVHVNVGSDCVCVWVCLRVFLVSLASLAAHSQLRSGQVRDKSGDESAGKAV